MKKIVVLGVLAASLLIVAKLVADHHARSVEKEFDMDTMDTDEDESFEAHCARISGEESFDELTPPDDELTK